MYMNTAGTCREGCEELRGETMSDELQDASLSQFSRSPNECYVVLHSGTQFPTALLPAWIARADTPGHQVQFAEILFMSTTKSQT
jgi:hypothetical protein